MGIFKVLLLFIMNQLTWEAPVNPVDPCRAAVHQEVIEILFKQTASLIIPRGRYTADRFPIFSVFFPAHLGSSSEVSQTELRPCFYITRPPLLFFLLFLSHLYELYSLWQPVITWRLARRYHQQWQFVSRFWIEGSDEMKCIWNIGTV